MTRIILVCGFSAVLILPSIVRLIKRGNKKSAVVVAMLALFATAGMLLYFLHVRIPSVLSVISAWMRRIGLYYPN
ncbi:MAG: hypothetical protein FWF10_10765 [Clostridiales bacterium]|nr:hypothetical protein [Clostridiales bacterium]